MRSAFWIVDRRWAMTMLVRPLEQPVEGLLDELLGLGVDRRGGLVEDQDAGIEGQGAGEGDELLLPHREPGAPLPDHGVEARRAGAR